MRALDEVGWDLNWGLRGLAFGAFGPGSRALRLCGLNQGSVLHFKSAHQAFFGLHEPSFKQGSYLTFKIQNTNGDNHE